MPSASAKSLESAIKKLEKDKALPRFMDPLSRLVFAVMSEQRSPADVEKAMGSVLKKFFDWNEARVARWVEIARSLDPLSNSDGAAIRLRNTLNRLFDLRGELSLDFFEDMKISEARKAFLDIDPEFKRDDINLILYQCLPTMTPPVTQEVVDVAKKQGVIAKNGSKATLQKLLSSNEDHAEAVQLLHYLEMIVLHDAYESTAKAAAKTTKKSRTSRKKS